MLAAICAAIYSPSRIRTIRMTQYRHKHPVRVLRINRQSAYLLSLCQPEMYPGLTAVRRPVDPVTHREIGSLDPFPAYNIDDIGIRRRYAYIPDRPRRLIIEKRTQ